MWKFQCRESVISLSSYIQNTKQLADHDRSYLDSYQSSILRFSNSMRCQQNFPKRSVSTVFWSQADAVEHMSNGCLEWLWKFFSPPHNPFVKAKSRRRKGGDQCFKRNYHNGTSFQWWGAKSKKKNFHFLTHWSLFARTQTLLVDPLSLINRDVLEFILQKYYIMKL